MRNKLITKTLLAFILLLVTTSIQAASLPPLTHKLTEVNPSLTAPGLRLKNMDDEIVDIENLRGKVIIINFWATWCPPCRREMGSLERLHLASADKDVVVLAVNVGEDDETVFSFMGTTEPSPTFSILFDTDSESVGAWKVQGLPTTFVVNPEGLIAYKAIGGREFDHPDILQKVIDLARQ